MGATRESLTELLGDMLKDAEAKANSMTKEQLEDYWIFNWDHAASREQNLYKFNKAIDVYQRQCRKWETLHNGSCCVVERVRDIYLMPKFKAFWAQVDLIEKQRSDNVSAE